MRDVGEIGNAGNHAVVSTNAATGAAIISAATGAGVDGTVNGLTLVVRQRRRGRGGGGMRGLRRR